jgi:hypothetical protein
MWRINFEATTRFRTKITSGGIVYLCTLLTSLVNSWVMYRSNMQERGNKLYFPHREFNYAISKKVTLFAKRPATTCMTESGVRNAHMLHYSMMWSMR